MPWTWPGGFAELGFQLVATRGTAAALRAAGLQCKTVFKVNEGRPNAVDLLKGGAIQLAIYTTTGAPAFHDEKAIRRSAVTYRVPCITTMSGARAAAEAIAARSATPSASGACRRFTNRIKRPRSRGAGCQAWLSSLQSRESSVCPKGADYQWGKDPLE